MAKRKKDKQLSTNITQKTKDWATRTPLTTTGELMCSEGYEVPVPPVDPSYCSGIKPGYK